MAGTKLDLSQEMQNKVLCLVTYSREFLSGMRERLKPEYFNTREQWTLCSLAYAYFDKYAEAPGEFLANEAAKHAKATRMSSDSYDLLLDLLDDLRPLTETEEEYVSSEVTRFVKHSEVRKVLEDFLPKYSTGEYDLDELLEPIAQVQRSTVEAREESGDALAEVSRRSAGRIMSDRSLEIPTLITQLDKGIRGIRRAQLGTVMAPSGIGKTFMLVHLGKAALMQSYGVFHYTLEMTRDEVLTRYDQMILGATEDELATPTGASKLAKKAVAIMRRGGKLQVVYLSYGYGNLKGSKIEALRRDFTRRAERCGKPDMVLIDYGDLLARSGKNRYEEQGDVWRALKSFAVEEDVAIWVATQAARSGVGVKRLTELEVGDSYEKVRVSDIFIGFNRNIIYDQKNKQWSEQDYAHNENTVRLFVIKHRGRRDKMDVTFACDFEHGVFYAKKATVLAGEAPDKVSAFSLPTRKVFT